MSSTSSGQSVDRASSAHAAGVAPATRRRPRLTALAAAVVATGLLAACGGGSDSGSADTDAAPADTEAPAESAVDSTAPADTAPATVADTVPAETQPTLPEPGEWAGPRFDEAIEPTMAAFGAAIGTAFDPTTPPAELTLPTPTPVPGAATITGVGWGAELDIFDGTPSLVESVGLDLAIDPAELDAWSKGAIEGWTSPSFAESGSLYTSLLIDGSDQRLVLLRDTDAPGSGRPALNLEWSPATDALRTPDWLAALPRPDGGELSSVTVARGDVQVGFAPGLDGYIEVRFDHPPTDLDRMIEYFEVDGTLLGAGFTYEPSPWSNTNYRRDVRIGDWEGSVAIGEVVVGDDLDSYQVIWQLTRG